MSVGDLVEINGYYGKYKVLFIYRGCCVHINMEGEVRRFKESEITRIIKITK